ncbi:MAG: pyridoxamine 5'-phosphate oxidase [Synechococcales bacterium]|nr:pyridoxamine 5'-phosphate oxidase [Synechococcales bacterium]
MKSPIANLREEYTLRTLLESDVSSNPFDQFQRWFDEAIAAQIHEPNAMTLATATADGTPSARIVLLKGFDRRGFVFYTNYKSRKGQELAENPNAALVFWWGELERQVRIEGVIAPVAAEESDAYFQSRPQGSQLGAIASPQSQVTTREDLEQRLHNLKAEYEHHPISRPSHWGGYRLTPRAIEFWQGRPNRLHDRLQYLRRSEESWTIHRLAP